MIMDSLMGSAAGFANRMAELPAPIIEVAVALIYVDDDTERHQMFFESR
jgi:hypothetical protein